MEKTAANDTVLLAQAQQRVQSMLEDILVNKHPRNFMVVNKG